MSLHLSKLQYTDLSSGANKSDHFVKLLETGQK